MTLPQPVLPDLLQPNLKLVFCGTAPSLRSADKQAYYAHPGNKFWQVIYDIRLTPIKLQPQQFRQVINFGLGLTDLVKYAKGSDADLLSTDYDTKSFHDKIMKYQPLVVAFTSKTGGKAYLRRSVDYGHQPETIGQTMVYVLPSTSGRASRYWNIKPWDELSKFLRDKESRLENPND
ncbi:MAG: mismatch-specific DNA-glycosylase [Rhodobacteraceae bacterium]|nr:mismatch-specific DNA-glycosylase [Paracoccaceae bacterium]MXZ51230.1 mismatch-specific DNA-glycosylase [Paracoccaceae bacterium]MYF46115.1 mismatch-specific DNA-glycosylase [Paracoccaceae bacterium]